MMNSGKTGRKGGRRAGCEGVAPVGCEPAELRLEDFLPYQLNILSSMISAALFRPYGERYGLGVPEWRVIVALGQRGVMTVTAMGEFTQMGSVKVSRAATELERRKLIARQSDRADLRLTVLSLTSAGRTLYRAIAPHAVAFARDLTAAIDPADLPAFRRAVATLTDHARALVEEFANHKR